MEHVKKKVSKMWQVQILGKNKQIRITFVQKLRTDETRGVVSTSGFTSVG
jgi:hypothetical protein